VHNARKEMKELEVETFMMGLEFLRRSLPKIGPYVLMALVLPGGPLIALLTYLYRRRANRLIA